MADMKTPRVNIGTFHRAVCRKGMSELVRWVGARSALRFALSTQAHPSITLKHLQDSRGMALAYAKARGRRFRRAIARKA